MRRKLIRPLARIRGLTLVELMVGILVGMFVIAGVIATYLTILRGGSETLKMARLNQEMRAAMDLMSFEIRRAGYAIDAAGALDSNLVAAKTIAISDSCILYRYKTPGTDEYFGFRLAPNSDFIEAYSSPNEFNCDSSGWYAVTDPASITITDLDFYTGISADAPPHPETTFIAENIDLGGSKCLHTSVAATPSAPNWWPTEPTTMTESPCENADNPLDKSGRLIEIRQVIIVMKGHSADDPNNRVARAESIRVRNDREMPTGIPPSPSP